jgi:hypothetical protein
VDGLSAEEIGALAEAFSDSVAARQVLEAAGLPRARHPVWNVPAIFWSEISSLIQAGALAEGRASILAAATALFPANEVFAGGASGTRNRQTEAWDIFISYTEVDRAWSEWIAWQLEDAGYRVLIQAWDFVAGTNWQLKMDEGVRHSRKTLAVLSRAYLKSIYGAAEWQAAIQSDPGAFGRKLLPTRVEECPRPGLLGGIVSIDLFGRSIEETRRHLLTEVRNAFNGRAKPARAPDFPVSYREGPPADRPGFPPPSERRARRDLLLRRLYEQVGDNLFEVVDAIELMSDYNLSRTEVLSMAQHLEDQGLVKNYQTLGGPVDISIATAGVLRVENMIESENQ